MSGERRLFETAGREGFRFRMLFRPFAALRPGCYRADRYAEAEGPGLRLRTASGTSLEQEKRRTSAPWVQYAMRSREDFDLDAVSLRISRVFEQNQLRVATFRVVSDISDKTRNFVISGAAMVNFPSCVALF